jgi:uncharacterized repeat protein (TIGR01451 family)
VAINSGLTDVNIMSIAVDPSTSTIVYAGTSSRGVFKSTDTGGSWRAVDTGEGGSSVTSLAVDPVVPATVFAATNSGVFRTLNGGASWAQTGNFFQSQQVAIDPANHLSVYASINGTIFKSTDGGTNWSATSLSSGQFHGLVVGPASAVYGATSLGVQKSIDGGATWTLEVAGLTDLNVLSIAAGTSAVYAGTGSGIFKSTNGGMSWVPSSTGMVGGSVNALAIDPVTQANVYAGSAGNGTDAFVTELNAMGTALVYSTYLGGNSFDQANAIAIDANGDAYVTGITNSVNFPVSPGGIAFGPGFFFNQVGFVTKLNSTGTALAYSTLLDTQGSTGGNGIAVDSFLNAYVTGQTSNQNYPVTPGAFQTALSGGCCGTDAFVSKLESSPGLSADLQVTQTVSPIGTINGNVTYTVTITNNGPDTAYNVIVADSLPAALVANGCFATGINCQEVTNGVVGTLNTLASKGTATLSVSGIVNCASAINGSTATNTVTVSASTPDSTPGNNSASVSNTISNPFGVTLPVQSTTIPTTGSNFSSFSVNAPPCHWQATSQVSWINVFFSSGSGNGFVEYTVQANNTGLARAGTITVSGQVFTVFQAGPNKLTTIGLYSPAGGTFFLKNSNSAGPADITFSFGPPGVGWTPLAGDWDGNGTTTVGLYNPVTGTFFLRNTNTSGPADLTFNFGPGAAGLIPIVGDWNGDGTVTIGLYDPSTSTFFLKNSNSAGAADITFQFGVGGHGFIPIAGNWTGTGTTTVGLYDPATGQYLLRNSNAAGPADISFFFGPAGAGWMPLTGDWDANATFTPGLYNQAGGAFFLRNTNSNGAADLTFFYGPAGAGWKAVTGDWTGQ